ncbi:MAG: ABC transporter substrate-binding protein [Methyloligellaceae bacterium]
MSDNKNNRRDFLKTAGAVTLGAGALPFLKVLPAEAAKSDTVTVAIGQTINSLDLHRKGTNRPSYQIAVNCYDRLLSFGTKKLPNGSLSYDYSVLKPDLAETWKTSEDGKSIIFNLRKDAVFSDGSPVTADDVKWSLDRAVSLGGFPAVQMKAGSLVKPEQFVVVDKHTFKINLIRPSKLTLPDLAVPVPFIINSKVAKKHATKKDPWATEYLHKNTAGSGAYKIARWQPGQLFVYERNEKWTSGPKPAVKKVIVREVPSLSTRRALIERKSVDLSFGIPDKDTSELEENEKLKVTATPIENCLYVVGVNLKFEPFKDKKVRQAIAYSIPYNEIFIAGAYGNGVKMWGAESNKPSDIKWPQPFPYDTNIDKAKELLAQTAHKDGFEVPLSINQNLASWMEPTALLIQEGLAKIGIKATIEKIPGANWRTAALVEKRLPLHLENFGGWLNYPDYYFFWAYLKGHLFNSSNYDNPEVAKLVGETLHMETDNPEYTPKIKRLIEIAFDDVPRIPLWQPMLSSAMKPELEGYEYWFHRQLDARKFKKA